MEKTLILVKPDAVKRGLQHRIHERFLDKGFSVVAYDYEFPPRKLVEEHYAEHKGKEFFNGLVDSLADKKVYKVVYERDDAVATARRLIGATKPELQVPGTIRGDYALSLRENSVHGSDSVESAEREINIWFGDLNG